MKHLFIVFGNCRWLYFSPVNGELLVHVFPFLIFIYWIDSYHSLAHYFPVKYIYIFLIIRLTSIVRADFFLSFRDVMCLLICWCSSTYLYLYFPHFHLWCCFANQNHHSSLQPINAIFSHFLPLLAMAKFASGDYRQRFDDKFRIRQDDGEVNYCGHTDHRPPNKRLQHFFLYIFRAFNWILFIFKLKMQTERGHTDGITHYPNSCAVYTREKTYTHTTMKISK